MKWFVDLFLGLEKNEDLERSPWRCGLCQLKIGEGICLTPNLEIRRIRDCLMASWWKLVELWFIVVVTMKRDVVWWKSVVSKYKGFGCCQQGWLDNSNVRNALRVILKVGTSTRVVMFGVFRNGQGDRLFWVREDVIVREKGTQESSGIEWEYVVKRMCADDGRRRG
jgi:hypothetical protein